MVALALLATIVSSSSASDAVAGTSQFEGSRIVVVEYFYGDGCPHCAAQGRRMADWESRFPGVQIRAYEVWNDAANAALFREVAAAHGVEATAVPATFIAGRVWIGYSDTVGALMEGLLATLTTVEAPPEVAADPAPANVISVPLLGEVEVAAGSLVAMTALVALVDGVNPCSLWVLTLLLAFALRTGNRRDLILVGVTFLAVTSAVYGLFIVGLFGGLNLIGMRPWIRVATATIALVFAAINLKDYLWDGRGPSLSIPDHRKPAIYRRMRAVTNADSRGAMLAGSATLALGASLVELPCTAGFPVIWTTTLAAQEVAATTFIVLLGLYLTIYLLDELAIFGTAAVTLRATKLQERQGRALKLISGMLMAALGLGLLLAPGLMDSVLGAVGLVAGAMVASGVILLIERSRSNEQRREPVP
jgi:hypothetical protein